MVTINELRGVPFFADADDNILAEILSFTRVETFQEGEIVYEQDSLAENFYILKDGKALLETDLSKDISISLAALKPGYVFGIYSLVSHSAHAMRAICSESSEVLVIPGVELRRVLEGNHSFGYRFMYRLCLLLKNRLDARTSQFVRILQRHPDLKLE
jgi:CRP/FNR family transcriptional regulator, cyclic AMP receptor protein